MHDTRHPDAGRTILVDMGQGPAEYRVEDWWDHLSGASYSALEFLNNWGCKNYITRVNAHGIPTDDEVLYGKIGGLDYLVHVSEILKEN